MAFWITWGLRIFTVCIVGVAIGFARDRAERELYAREHVYEAIRDYWTERNRTESEAEVARIRRQTQAATEQIEANAQRIKDQLADYRRQLEAEGRRLDAEGEVLHERLKDSVEAVLVGPRASLADLDRREQEARRKADEARAEIRRLERRGRPPISRFDD